MKAPRSLAPIAANQYINGVKPIAGTAGPVINPYNPNEPANVYYQWGNITEYISQGHSNYHALTVKGQKSIGNGISFVLAYTWAHAIDNASGYASTSQASSGNPQNSYNLQAEKGTSDFNVGQRIAVSPVVELPFGKNKPYLTHGLGAAVAGGWQLSGIYQYDSGRPFTVGITTNNSGSVYGTDRPNQTGNPNTGPKTVAQWFNTAAFSANAVGTFGTERRNSTIGPNLSQLDIALERRILISERYSASLRFESFDVFNKANFYNPLGLTTGALNTTNYGKLTQANDPRSIQFSGKFYF